MKVILLIVLFVSAHAASITLTFRGLDMTYLLRPFSLSTLREVLSCHANIPYESIHVESITYLNETVALKQFDPVYPIKCVVTNSVRWNSQWMPGTSELIKELQKEEPVYVNLALPDTIKLEGVNILEFIITCINEKYANILVYDYTYFYRDSLKILSHHAILPFGGLLGRSEYTIIMAMFLIQIIIIGVANSILRGFRVSRTPYPSSYNYDKIHVTVK